MSELTPHEKRLLANAGEFRGYSPHDGVTEPDVAPTGVASASSTPDDPEPGEQD
ncbi:hypothetical protein [Saccharopolyspora phatthalungensis]|uniref:Uncharacterized protein n=1 Tax=Saccharopolyspora phatthalungensis TaxID=664693 RepID=A0A840Q3G9_9PSEU|nr:hypothetical protein [Saccharopolyspora phatthalungensis]MBB5157062.1 hypothetical protein [Saccharopolyspora phatthalungensis]